MTPLAPGQIWETQCPVCFCPQFIKVAEDHRGGPMASMRCWNCRSYEPWSDLVFWAEKGRIPLNLLPEGVKSSLKDGSRSFDWSSVPEEPEPKETTLGDFQDPGIP